MPGSGAERLAGGWGRHRNAIVARPDVLDQAATAYAVAADYFWGNAAPPATVIPYGWLAPPATFRAYAPINSPRIQTGTSAVAVQPNAASIAQYGEFELPVTLSALSSADGPALAYWFSTYYAGFRMRCPSLTINLLDARRTPDQVWRVLGIRIGDRISIPDAPATWPEGTSTLLVEGIRHTVSQNERLVTFNCSPVIGASPGVPGPWFRLDASFLGSTDNVPF
jgi:hypothetical protein